jgi:hypothetical protein
MAQGRLLQAGQIGLFTEYLWRTFAKGHRNGPFSVAIHKY